VLLGEYNNVGPGAWSPSRVSYSTNLTASQAAAYDLTSFIGETSWIDMTAYNADAAFTFSVNGTSGTATSSATVPSATATADATSLHPTSGTMPPQGAVLVSVNGNIAGSFNSLNAALASLPTDATNQTIFIYPGSYTEQVSVNRAGSVKIIGYQSGNPGQAYKGNQVTVTFAKGLSVVSPVAAGRSNADTATFATASSKISVYNVNFINTENLDGSVASYVTLASSIYGDQIGFYGCSFVGWQDTLLTGNPAGYAYYESSYIEGAIDFIWGYSMSYFKGCTIAAKKAKSCITAQSRASASAIGGYIFDQCLFTTAASSAADLTQTIYLGRPYSQFATVSIKYSYLDDSIQPAGWKAWSTSEPRLDHATFTEFQNTGPGNWENNAAARVAFGNATLLTSDKYPLGSVMASTSWIDLTFWNSIVTPTPAIVPVIDQIAANSTYPGNATCIVSKSNIVNQTTYTTIQSCINTLTTGQSQATIFIYPGIYDEQIVFNRTGPTTFVGYAPQPGTYSNNEVTIQNSAGVNTKSDQSNSDSATFYNRGKNVKFYNINFVNKFGTTKDYASLAFASGNNGYTSFYGCQMIGNQDTFDINSGRFRQDPVILQLLFLMLTIL
jgi:pectin methylesterase-like acyl-CoA thioesterase